MPFRQRHPAFADLFAVEIRRSLAMRVQSSRLRKCTLAPAFLGLLLAVPQPSCHVLQKLQKPESKSEAAQAVQPGMFTLTADQLSHLKTAVVGKTTWSVAVHTTGKSTRLNSSHLGISYAVFCLKK